MRAVSFYELLKYLLRLCLNIFAPWHSIRSIPWREAMCMSRVTIASLAILTVANVASAVKIRVPGDYSTIQSGIDAAEDGDTVIVAEGIYTGDGNRDIDFQGKAIVVMPENGPLATIIDCDGSEQDQHRGFFFHSAENSGSILQGFTIRDGVAHGEVWPENSGGAILIQGGSRPTIADNIITGNRGDFGGGITVMSSPPVIKNNSIIGNESDFGGGGIYCYSSSPTIEDNSIVDNRAGRDGGGIDCYRYSSPGLLGNIVMLNTSGSGGGGIVCGLESHPTMEGNTITENIAEYGGGIYSYWGSSPTIGNSTISGNIADIGGAIYLSFSPLTADNTVLESSDDGRGSDFYRPEFSSVISNCIFWGDSPDEIHIDSGDMILAYCDVQGGWPGEGNIDEDPMFVDPFNDDFHLLSDSPCIDTGDPDSPNVRWGAFAATWGRSSTTRVSISTDGTSS